MLQTLVFLPLLAAIIAGFGNRALGNTLAKVVTTGALFISAMLSWITFFDVGFGDVSYTVPVMDWMRSGDFVVDWSLRLDTLTAVMLIVITTVSSLVHLYSWGYMAEDPDQPRFFAYLSLFTFAMLMLVTANNLVQMFFGWEGVGLASYLLIGFWYYKPSANAAAIKAFVVNRVGDFGFSLGIFGVFLVFGTVDISVINGTADAYRGGTFTFLGTEVDILTTLCLLLFVGAMGKSAQLGLHTWLPDAMEGPTPVSALIHAATMVTAGVFMVCRLSPLFEAAPAALTVVTYVGAATALFAATVGTVQTDIKRVIAYSTCSQLGYMFFAAGVGAYGVAMFHLTTHAFFKALLFLGAGSVIHAMHHEQEMTHYGALRKEIPFTYWAMMIGTLAITGVGIPLAGIGFAGFYSKDMIIESAFASGSTAGFVAFAVGVFAALLTSFYSWRLIFLTFFGKPRWAGSEHIRHAVHDHPSDEDAGHPPHEPAEPVVAEGTGGYHPHESPAVMLIPLAILSLGAIFSGWLFYYPFTGAEEGAEFWRGSLAFAAELMEEAHHVPVWVKLSPFVAMVTGFLIAWNNYIRRPGSAPAFAAQFSALYDFLKHKWYFDELYHYVFVVPAMWLGRTLWRRGDEGTIDRFGPNGIAGLVGRSSVAARALQSGYVYSYALVMLIGLAAAAAWFLPGMLRGE
ncbi:NADH-quinone oxidoreductase subunit L [Pacificimonas flava]|uniref:NADH-ubiquinone oxidoreductase chain 5 n=2 Tax=Pacificimonas TaxID=1960290 RepID=A0A219B8D7_9SPHN|nr:MULTISPECIES: NADH-quinone oxidoreductase subunit L [Pacificimonas]MBZ6378724.1 NADH-quinone oxidoreductase subunit L [Pacificimonas aurantium]OWV34008.1 NADH-quinone oxidoreductase subunit L [Pacificimonas flava]